MRQLDETLLLLAGQDESVEPKDLVDRIERDLAGDDMPLVAREESRAGRSRSRDGWRPPWKTVVAAAAIAALVVGIPLWVLGGADLPDLAPSGDVVTSSGVEPSADVFDPTSDSLCEWITAGDMNDSVAAAQVRAGTEYDFRWITSCTGGFWKSTLSWQAGDLSPRVAVSSLAEADRAVVAAYAEVTPDQFVGHPLLDDSVSYRIRTYQFMWQEGVDFYLRVEGHEDDILYFGFGIDDHNSDTHMTPAYEELALALANEVLVRMNWVDPRSAGPFSWGDDLSLWVTPAEMTAAVEAAAAELGAGTAAIRRADFGALRSDSFEIRMGEWTISVHEGSHGGAYDGPPTSTDPRLPTGVAYEVEDGFGWGFYIFAGPASGETIAIQLRPPGSSLGYPHTSEIDEYEGAIFTFASAVLRELGWVV